MLFRSLLPYELPGPAQLHRLPFATPEMELSATHMPMPHTIDVAQCVLDLEARPASLFVILLDWTPLNLWADLPQIRSTCSVIRASRRHRSGESRVAPPPIVPLRALPSSSWHSIPKVITLDTSPGSEICGLPPSVIDLTHLSPGIAQPSAPRICHGGGSPASVIDLTASSPGVSPACSTKEVTRTIVLKKQQLSKSVSPDIVVADSPRPMQRFLSVEEDNNRSTRSSDFTDLFEVC